MVEIITIKNIIPICVPLNSNASFKYETDTNVSALVPYRQEKKEGISLALIDMQELSCVNNITSYLLLQILQRKGTIQVNLHNV